MNKKTFLKNWTRENKRRIIITIIIVLVVFIPILAIGHISLKASRTELFVSDNSFKTNPVAIYENGKKHLFWVERDINNNFTIKHYYDNTIYNRSYKTSDFFHFLDIKKSNDFLYLIWENNGSMFYMKGQNTNWGEEVLFSNISIVYNYENRFLKIDEEGYFHYVSTWEFGVSYRNYSTITDEWSDTIAINNSHFGGNLYNHNNPNMEINNEGKILITWECSTHPWLDSDTILAYCLGGTEIISNKTVSSSYARYANNAGIWKGSDGQLNVFWFEASFSEGRISTRSYNQTTDLWDETKLLFDIVNHMDDNRYFTVLQNPENSDKVDIIWERSDGSSFVEYWWGRIKSGKKSGLSSLKPRPFSWDTHWFLNHKGKVSYVTIHEEDNIDFSMNYCIEEVTMKITAIYPFTNLFALLGILVVIIFWYDLLLELNRDYKQEKDILEMQGRRVEVYVMRPTESKIIKVKELWKEIEGDNLEILLAQDESEYLDFKTDYEDKKDSREKLEKLIVAMANTYGGIIAFGVNNDKKIVYLSWKKRDRIGHRINDIVKKIQDPFKFEQHFIVLEEDKGVFCIFIPKYSIYPLRTSSGKYYWRHGSHSENIPPRYILLNFELEQPSSSEK